MDGEQQQQQQNIRQGVTRSRHDNHDSDEIMNTQQQFEDSDSAYGVEGASPGSGLLSDNFQLGQNTQAGDPWPPEPRISNQVRSQSLLGQPYLFDPTSAVEQSTNLNCDGRQDSASEVRRNRQPVLLPGSAYQRRFSSQSFQQQRQRWGGRSNSVDLCRFASAPLENIVVDMRGKGAKKRDSASDLNTLLDDARSISLQNDMLVAARQLLAQSEAGPSSSLGVEQQDSQADLGVATAPELVAEAAALGLSPTDQISESGRIILDTMDSPRTGNISPSLQHIGQEFGESSRDVWYGGNHSRNFPNTVPSSNQVSQLRMMRSYDSDDQYEEE
eukprot:TRINITY_DN17093_c0_g1_i2.p2 TRINITY_DN17093_c0_g1~~TRINITY_DN17093_c0_g1_i2.p2  ORF type:complete len:330 (-),score=48.58 TRINITY_DN17093_c0_g1_i2:440-1429(-)